MAHTFSNLVVHVIFSTKDRRPLINPEIKKRLFEYMGGIIREEGGNLLAINGPEDHVHLLFKIPHAKSLADLMRVLKTNSSRWVHEIWGKRGGFAWQAGYGVFSVSESNVPSVSRYIADQEEHHKKVSFKEEFVAFLKNHGIEYNERYLWK